VFPGNTADPHTFAAQLEKVKTRFGATAITFVGDRGMIKGQQIEDLAKQGFHYITAITKPQIDKLLRIGTFQMDLFDQELAEVLADEGIRYVLRRESRACPRRSGPPGTRNWSRFRRWLLSTITTLPTICAPMPRGRCRSFVARAKTLRIADWVELTVAERAITLTVQEDAAGPKLPNSMAVMLLKTDLSPTQAKKELVHDR